MSVKKDKEVNRMIADIQNEAAINRKDVQKYMHQNREEVAKMLDKALRGFRRRR